MRITYHFIKLLIIASCCLLLVACQPKITTPTNPAPTVAVAAQNSTRPAPSATPTRSSTIFLPLLKNSQTIATPIPSPTPTSLPPDAPTPEPCLSPGFPPPANERPQVGLHASADPQISPLERCLFIELRPSLIKVMSFHPPQDVAKLAQTQPDAHWIVRAFLQFGGRAITPDQFVEWTLEDTRRTLRVLEGKSVVVELHNEPNLTAEGLGTAWADGAEFADWWLAVLAQYRAALPGVRFIYPGLSPGDDVVGIRQGHRTFIEQGRRALAAADGLGVHLYWSQQYPMQQALDVLDDYAQRFPDKLIWVTEASHNKPGIDDIERARQYLTFVDALKLRAGVEGVTFFVASSIDDTFSAETWLHSDLAARLGARDR